ADVTAALPALKDGDWRIVVRTDLYNEVYEGDVTYTTTGLDVAPGEANNSVPSATTISVTVPTLTVASTLSTTLSTGQARPYNVSVAAGQTLRVLLDSSAANGDNQPSLRYADIPPGFAYDAAYSNASAADQQLLNPTTQAGDYYVLVAARAGNDVPVTLRAD